MMEQMKRYHDAIKCYDRLISFQPNNYKFYDKKGNY